MACLQAVAQTFMDFPQQSQLILQANTMPHLQAVTRVCNHAAAAI